MASPDNEPAPVLLHTARGQFVLLHPITWEAVELRADRAPWQLARDADGRFLLRDSAGDPSPVERYFAQHLVFSDNSEAQVHSASGAPMSLAEFRSLHVVRYCRLEVPILPACSIISHIDAKLLCVANGECGCRILWEFRRLQRFLFPESDYYQSARWLRTGGRALWSWRRSWLSRPRTSSARAPLRSPVRGTHMASRTISVCPHLVWLRA